MEKMFKIGLIIADNDEYEPLNKYVKEYSGSEAPLFFLKGHKIPFTCRKKDVIIRSVLCGVGKVNSSTATAYLINEGVNIIVNVGLSGGISGVKRGDLIIGESFMEHDFDLTCFGYKFGEKPGQEYIYNADKELLGAFSKALNGVKCGTFATGDCFVNNEAVRNILKEDFGAAACDMETAAIAYAAKLASIPFCSIRRISDDAAEDATTSYRDMNNLQDSSLIDIVLAVLKDIDIGIFK